MTVPPKTIEEAIIHLQDTVNILHYRSSVQEEIDINYDDLITRLHEIITALEGNEVN